MKIGFCKNKKEEKGAITLYVLISCLFFIFILTQVYISNLNKLKVQEQQLDQIKENYERPLDKAEEIYQNI